MASRVLRRRAATAVGVYGAALVGFLATVIAARELDKVGMGLLTLVIATTGFLQMLLDFTIDEALVKYGFRYSAREEFGRLRRLFQIGTWVKLGGGALGTVALLVLAPFANTLFGEHGLTLPLLVAAPIPLVQSPEGLAGTAILLRQRTDVRAAFLFVSMALRLAGIGIGASFGVWQAALGMTAAQVAASAAVVGAGWKAYRSFPLVPAEPLGDDGPALRTFVVQSTIGTGIASARGTFPAMLVGLVTGATQVANFRIAQSPQTAFQSLSAPARLVLLAEQTHDFEHGQIARMRSMLRRYMLGTTAVLVVATPLLWWGMAWLVPTVYGAKYHGSAVTAARLILVAASLQVIWGWTKSFPVSIGRPMLRIVAQGAEVIVLVPALLLMASRWGATGAAAATICSTVVFAAVWSVMLFRIRNGVLAVTPPGPPLPRAVADEVLTP